MNTTGLIMELIGATVIDIQIIESVEYLEINKDDK